MRGRFKRERTELGEGGRGGILGSESRCGSCTAVGSDVAWLTAMRDALRTVVQAWGERDQVPLLYVAANLQL